MQGKTKSGIGLLTDDGVEFGKEPVATALVSTTDRTCR